MSTQYDDYPAEPDPREISRRLRSYMGDKKVSRKALALASGVGRTPLGAKLDDQGNFTIPELIAVSRALGVSWLWVMTGDGPATGGPNDDGPGGLPIPPSPSLLLPRVDSNHEPSDPRSRMIPPAEFAA